MQQDGDNRAAPRQLGWIALTTVLTLCVGWIGLASVARRLLAASGDTIEALGSDLALGLSAAALLAAGPLIALLFIATRTAHRERMQADAQRQAMRDSERWLHAILEVDPEGVLVLDTARRIVHINPAGRALFAAAFSEEVLGKDVAAFIHPDDRPGFERSHHAALDGRGVVTKGRLIGLSGAVVWIEMNAVRLADETQDCPAVLGVFRDITEQRRSERRQALQHAVAKVLAGSSSVQEALPELVRVVTTVLEWHAGRLWRVRDEDRMLVCVHTWWSACSPGKTAESGSGAACPSGAGLPGRCWSRGEPLWLPNLKNDAEGMSPVPLPESDLHTACAFPIWLRANVYGVMEFFSREAQPPDQDLLRALGIIGSQVGLFIERTEVEAALREHEARTRQIIDTALDAVIAIDAHGTITEWNAQAETMFGWLQHEAIGRDLAETIIPPVHRRAHRDGLARFLATGRAPVLNRLIETIALRRDGSEFPVELAIAPLRSDQGLSFSAFIRDITPRKEAERSLTSYAQQLEQSNRDLDAALAQARAATEAKSSFLATMSHEIRTPMNGIIGMTGLLLDTDLTPEQREFAETVRHCGDHLLMLINDILDFSKIEAGKLSLELIPFDPRTAIEDSLELVAERASSKGLNLACLFHADVPRGLVGDPGRVRQVLMNLVGNAIKFTERGDIVVRVTVDEQSAEEALIRVAVTDTGIGIPDEAQARLFQSFSQADGSTTRKYGGTGLGLAISKRLVELMGGAIGLESRVGQGSCFWFTVRLRKDPTASAVPEPRRERLRGLRVLIVDDKAINRTILESLTTKWGMQPTMIDGAPALWEWLARQDGPPPFDLALLDGDLDTVDGFELARALKNRAGWGAVPLVLLTSLGRRGAAKAARDAGLAAYLTKPIRESQLYEALVAALEGGSADPRSPATDPACRAPLVTRHTVAEAQANRHLRVLLAEDNVVNQKVAVRLFERLGYRVDVVANGAAAVEAASRTAYDAIFMDCQMPEMDGFEATRRIREQEARQSSLVTGHSSGDAPLPDGRLPMTAPRVPIIAMTANAMEGDRDRCLAAGMDDYVAKPATLGLLAAVLERRVPAARAEHPGAEHTAIDPLIFAGLRELAGDEAPDFLQMVVDHFLGDLSRSLDAMEQAATGGAFHEVSRVAHRMKGGASHVGALGLAAACERVRRFGDVQDGSKVQQELRALRAEAGRVRDALDRLRREPGPQTAIPPQAA